jgi:hypothetical protein
MKETGTRMVIRSKLFAAMALALGLGSPLFAAPVHDYGCLASSGEDLHGRVDSRGLGPLVEWADQGVDRPAVRAVRPFFSLENDARTGKEDFDILWPVAHIRHWKGQTDWRFLTAFYLGPHPTEPSSQYAFWILPVFAMGRNKAGEAYGALFPLGGRVDNWFGRDRMEFALFPLYAHSELNDLRTDHWLWPFVSRTTGDNLYRFRVFPFYGKSEKKGEGESKFILWPFWTSVRRDHPGNRGGGFMLFPFYGHSKTDREESWMFLPPFFRHTVGRNLTQNIYFWPFYQTEKSKNLDKLYAWPLYGRRTTADENRRFWLWPFVWKRHEKCPPVAIDKFRVFPLYESEATSSLSAPTNVVERYVSVWPLGSYERKKHDYKRVRCLDLWPFRETAPIERNLSPLWSLYQYEQTPSGSETELLWGAARWGSRTNGASYGSLFPLASWSHDRGGDTQRGWEFLKGLLGYERNETGKTWRALYFIRWRTEP